MKFKDLLTIVSEEPLFETGLLLSGHVEPTDVRRQLSRWVQEGRIHQLRRGLYTLAPPYQKVIPHPFLLANWLVHGSYVSCQSALAHYSLIPEHVPVMTSVTTQRPGCWTTPLGQYEFRHIQQRWFMGYQRLLIVQGQLAYIASPEKALLDLAYLQAGADDPAYLHELRLQNLHQLDRNKLWQLAVQIHSPKLQRVAEQIIVLAEQEAAEYEVL